MTRILAHRGACAERPENTMAAFRRAAEVGADGIELDIHMLWEGPLVVHHDLELGRCEANASGNLCLYTPEELAQVDAGSKFSPEYAGERIPLFSEVLEFLSQTDLFLNVEIKEDKVPAPQEEWLPAVAREALLLLEKYGMEKRCILSSFCLEALQAVRNEKNDVPLGLLYSENFCGDMVQYARQNRFQALHPDFHLVDEKLMEEARRAGIQVNAWTVNGEENVRRMLALGADCIICNDPAAALRTAGR